MCWRSVGKDRRAARGCCSSTGSWRAQAIPRSMSAPTSPSTCAHGSGTPGSRTHALEEAQTLDELRPSVLSTLQLGANVLRRPDEAAVHLLGIRTYRERF